MIYVCYLAVRTLYYPHASVILMHTQTGVRRCSVSHSKGEGVTVLAEK
jgi:hypothetical protein